VITGLALVYPSMALRGLFLSTAGVVVWVAVVLLRALRTSELEGRDAGGETLDSNGYFEQLLAASPAMALCVRSDGTLCRMNQAAADVLGLQGLDGQTLGDVVISPAYAQALMNAWFAGDDVWLGEVDLCKEAGVALPMRFSASLHRRDGCVWMVGTAAAELSQVQAELDLEKKKSAVGLLVAGVGHDFNNVLTPMIGYLDILVEDTKDGEAREDLRHVQSSARRANDLVRQMLMLGRMTEGLAESRPLCDLGLQVSADVAHLKPRFVDGQTLTLDLGITSAGVIAAPFQLSQIVLNLVSNARQALSGRPGNVCVTMCVTGPQTQQAVALHSGRWVCLAVADDGPGMSEQVRSQVFQPYFSTKPVGRGTGLGLSVVQGIVEELGGYIEVESELRGGARFSVWLPRRSVSNAVDDAPTVPVLFVGSGSVLIVEDDQAVARLVSRVMTRGGYRVTVCARAEEVLQRLSAASGAYDLVLTDLELPGRSGIELASDLCLAYPGLPVVLMSGQSFSSLPTGVWSCLSKPLSLGVLTRIVHENLAKGREARAA
jgi:signal transduction histidine kinase/CheY-like chemotaxis protein